MQPNRARRAGRGARLCTPGYLLLGLALALRAVSGQAEPATPASAVASPPYDYPIPQAGSYELPALGEAGDGAVLTSDGEPQRLRRLLEGKIAILSFIYTSCHDAGGCPLAFAVLSQIAQRMRSDARLADSLRLVTLSFDPQHDRPEVMRRYRESLVGGQGVDWLFMTTASRAALQPILAAYGQTITPDPPDSGAAGGFSHLLRVFLVDREGRIRNIYSADFLQPDLLLSDVRTLLLEEQGGPGTPAEASQSAGGLPGTGDARGGYESRDYRTNSRSPATRRGRPADLLALARTPPMGLPEVPVPAGNPLGRDKIDLGRKLFFDRRLSLNDTFSCAMCHIPEQGFTSNELATAVGIEGRTVRRNAPTLYNVAYAERLFHDGRENRLEQQVWQPMLAGNEMGNPSIGSVIDKLEALPDYAGLFEAAFAGRGPSMETVGMAIAAYERTLLSASSRFDRWYYGGDQGAMSSSARRGFALFAGKARCSRCHSVGQNDALFTDQQFHDTGIGYRASMDPEPDRRRLQLAPGVFVQVETDLIRSVGEPRPPDLGRYEVTRDPADRWRYRTPTLRNIALTAPYMHDGSISSLEEVVAFYNRGGVAHALRDPLIEPLKLDEQERRDLVAFLETLTGENVATLVSDGLAAPVGDPRGQAAR